MEHKLWIAVLVQGLSDACGKFLWLSRSNKKHQHDAIEWINSKDFKLVCEFAGCESKQVVDIYKALKKHSYYLNTEDIRNLFYEALTRRSIL